MHGLYNDTFSRTKHCKFLHVLKEIFSRAFFFRDHVICFSRSRETFFWTLREINERCISVQKVWNFSKISRYIFYLSEHFKKIVLEVHETCFYKFEICKRFSVLWRFMMFSWYHTVSRLSIVRLPSIARSTKNISIFFLEVGDLPQIFFQRHRIWHLKTTLPMWGFFCIRRFFNDFFDTCFPCLSGPWALGRRFFQVEVWSLYLDHFRGGFAGIYSDLFLQYDLN